MMHKYQSVQLKMPPEVASRALSFQDKFIDQGNLSGSGFEDRPHVTVLYGLEDRSLEDVKRIFEGFGPVTVWFGEVGIFLAENTGKPEDVVYAEVLGREVDILHLLCAAYLPYQSTNPLYRPHMTLAYMKPGTAINLRGNAWFEGLKVKVDGIEFAQINEVTQTVKLSEEVDIEGRAYARVPEWVRPLSGSIAAAFEYKIRNGKGYVPKQRLDGLLKLAKELRTEMQSGD